MPQVARTRNSAPHADEQRTTRSSGRHALSRPLTGRTGHGSDKEAQTPDEAVEAAPKGLILHLKQKGTAEPPLRMQKQPQLPYSMTAPSDYRRKWGSSTPHRERSYCSNTSKTTGGWATATGTTPSRISRLARQPLSPYRERTEERSDRFCDRQRSRKRREGSRDRARSQRPPWRAR